MRTSSFFPSLMVAFRVCTHDFEYILSSLNPYETIISFVLENLKLPEKETNVSLNTISRKLCGDRKEAKRIRSGR